MTKKLSRNPGCYSELKPVPSFRINPDNIIKQLKSIETSDHLDITTASEEVQLWIIQRMVRLFGNRYMTTSIPTLLRMSRLVLMGNFQGKANTILSRYNAHLVSLHDSSIREKEGELEKAMMSTDEKASWYIHHIIPQERGGIDASDNFFQINEGDHYIFHEIFRTLTPVEQLANIVLLFRSIYNTELVISFCELILSQNQNLHHNVDFLRHKQVEYPKGAGSFIRYTK